MALPARRRRTLHAGGHETQRLLAELFRAMLTRFLAEQVGLAGVGGGPFLYWEDMKSGSRLAPDVYVLPEIEPMAHSWKFSATAGRPSFALKVVGNIAKNYEDGAALYEKFGVDELLVFDPRASQSSRRRVRHDVSARPVAHFSRSSRSTSIRGVSIR